MDAPLTVNRARLSGAGGTRGDVARWLEAVPLAGLGLGPEELLYVPLLRTRVARHEGADPRVAGRRISDRLRALLERAERDPMTAPPRDGACRFSSRPRYLAWLAALWLRDGSAAARATFAAATGCASPRQWQRTALLRDGAVLVPIAAALARAGIAARWIGMLDAADLALARDALADRFGLQLEQPATPAAIRRRAHPGAPVASRRGEAPAAGSRSPARAHMAEAAASLDAQDGQWRSLAPARRQLLLTLIALALRPASGGARDFAAQLAVHAGDEAEPPAAAPSPAGLPAAPNPAGAAAARGPEAGIAFSSVAAGTPAATSGMSRDPVPPAGDRSASGQAGAAARAAVASSAPAADEGFSSAYAGMLFLLNAFVALGLYPDFAEPRRARIAPSPLWLADRIGRCWFGAAYRRDALCRWIAEHARGGGLPASWAVEREWLAGFGTDAPPHAVERDGRVTLWHADGFPLADGPAARPRRLRALARRCGCTRRPLAPVRRARRHRLPRAADARWTACLAHYLDARIRIAAGDPALGLSSLALAGELSVRDLELTARFRLDSHPVGLRMAGLDRNLGWQPAEGRSIGFRFE